MSCNMTYKIKFLFVEEYGYFLGKKNISLNDHDFSCSADLSLVREELALYDLMVISLSEAEAAAIGILMERGRGSRPEWDTRTHLFLLH